VRHAALDDLLARADVVSLHCPLTPATAGMIDAAALARMKRSAILVNVARGGVVVEADLVRALRDGTILAAASDVFDTEPLPADSELLGLENMTVTPHLAAMAADNFEPTVRRMFDNIARAARGEALPPGDIVVP
jgi:phosphoglycerate dehydrogenase-like enzyme